MFDELIFLELIKKVRGVTMQRKNTKNDTDYPLILTRELASEFIGVSPVTFDKLYSIHRSFPIVKNGEVEKAYPRDPIVKWISENWKLIEKKRKI
ncbi:hypothetical protein [Pseudolactococcus piscium]|uniref:hypothetical protein n=1 Tax=Pseudolactococcus piscium TaxID=1364 RepID=UPI001FE9E315|nr:hypothetical protein [Lactococcus piscium]